MGERDDGSVSTRESRIYISVKIPMPHMRIYSPSWHRSTDHFTRLNTTHHALARYGSIASIFSGVHYPRPSLQLTSKKLPLTGTGVRCLRDGLVRVFWKTSQQLIRVDPPYRMEKPDNSPADFCVYYRGISAQPVERIPVYSCGVRRRPIPGCAIIRNGWRVVRLKPDRIIPTFQALPNISDRGGRNSGRPSHLAQRSARTGFQDLHNPAPGMLRVQRPRAAIFPHPGLDALPWRTGAAQRADGTGGEADKFGDSPIRPFGLRRQRPQRRVTAISKRERHSVRDIIGYASNEGFFLGTVK